MSIATAPGDTLGQLVRYMLKLGALGFGGPVALVGYMQGIRRRHHRCRRGPDCRLGDRDRATLDRRPADCSAAVAFQEQLRYGMPVYDALYAWCKEDACTPMQV